MGNDTGPSPHLTWAELACRDADKTPYPMEWRANRAVELAKAFERVRELCGFPVSVNSGYRTAVYNDKIGGARQSQHVEGRALDLKPPKELGRRGMMKLRAAADKAAREGLVGGIGHYNGFVHIDTRPRPESGRVARWRGSRTPI